MRTEFLTTGTEYREENEVLRGVHGVGEVRVLMC